MTTFAVASSEPGLWKQIFNFDSYGDLLSLLHNSVIAGAVLGIIGGLISVFVMMRDLPFAVHGISELSFAGAAGDRERIAVDEAAFDQALRQDADASGAIKLDRGEAAAWLEVAQQRRAPADAVDVIDMQLDADLSRHR